MSIQRCVFDDSVKRVADPIIKLNTGIRVAILTVLYNYVLSFCLSFFIIIIIILLRVS